jgi:Ni,Fe-hydrogenase III component G
LDIAGKTKDTINFFFTSVELAVSWMTIKKRIVQETVDVLTVKRKQNNPSELVSGRESPYCPEISQRSCGSVRFGRRIRDLSGSDQSMG